MDLASTIKSGVKTQGKILLDNEISAINRRVSKLKELENDDHVMYDDDTGYHCAAANYGIQCYDVYGKLPKGTPPQKFMDTLFHTLENLPPLKEMENLIYEIENQIGEAAEKAKQKALELMKKAMKKLIAELKEFCPLFKSYCNKLKPLEWVKEIAESVYKLFKATVSADLEELVEAVMNIFKIFGKAILKILQYLYEPYINTILLMMWWANVLVQFMMLLQARLQAISEFVNKVSTMIVSFPSDTCCRCTMELTNATNSLIDEAQDLVKQNSDMIQSSISDMGVSDTVKDAMKTVTDTASGACSGMCQEIGTDLAANATAEINQIFKGGCCPGMSSLPQTFQMPDFSSCCHTLNIFEQMGLGSLMD